MTQPFMHSTWMAIVYTSPYDVLASCMVNWEDLGTKTIQLVPI
jgi:hypothetical protein